MNEVPGLAHPETVGGGLSHNAGGKDEATLRSVD